EEFQLTIKSDPQNLVGYKMLATTYEKQGMSQEALKYFQMVLDLEPGEIEVAEKIEQLKAALRPAAAPAPEPPAPFQALPAEPLPAETQAPQAEPVTPAQPEPPAEPALVLEPAMATEPVKAEAQAAGPAEQAIAIESAAPLMAEPAAPVIEQTEQSASAAAAPQSEPALAAPAEPAAEGEATPTLAEIYAQQGHFEKAIDIYQQLIAANPGNETYKARMDELLAKAYPDEMSPGGAAPAEQPAAEAKQPEPAAQAQTPPAAPAEATDKMFSQMFAAMEQAAVGKELNIPDSDDSKTTPLQLAPEPAKEEVNVEPPAPAMPAAPVMPAAQALPAAPAASAAPAAPEPAAPVNFGALFTPDEKSSMGIEPPAQPASGGAEEPKKDEAVSSFQSWLSSLQK
ncbi:MAG TPA: tetratricopeptide repeat protein, partial [Candidatus Edwardsbacteria bacterium]|nr:tetratricopeptide repeat protein [Candidatus Edwardsbacteria bacterium]